MARTSNPAAPLLDPAVQRHLAETVRSWLGVPRGAADYLPALPERLARLLLRLPEHEHEERDRWGRWDHEQSERYETRSLWEAPIDAWVAERRAQTPGSPLWPHNAPFAVCLTHDVDLVSSASTPAQIARYARAGLDREGSGVVRFARPAVRVARSLRAGVSRAPSTSDTLERSAEILRRRGLTASYLFTVPGSSRFDCAYAPEDMCAFRGRRMRIADVMRALADEGFDVGLHGSYGASGKHGALAAERTRLADATGLAITSTRQHLLSWDVRWTPALQEKAGLRVDSSLGFNRNVGFRAGTSLPFRWFDVSSSRTLELIEVPVVLSDVGLLGSWGRGLELRDAKELVSSFADDAARMGTVTTVVFHPDKLVRDDWLDLYETTLDEFVARGAWVTSLAGLETWWREREARLDA